MALPADACTGAKYDVVHNFCRKPSSSAFHPEKSENHYQTALQALVTAKVKGKKITASPETRRVLGGNVVDLMAALRASVEGKAASKAKPTKSSKKSA